MPSDIGNKHSSLLQCKTNYSCKKFYSTERAKEPCLQILEINTLAYYNAKLITAVKSFITGRAKEPCLQTLEINTLAYDNTKLITAVKSFIIQGELKSLVFKYWK